MLYEDVEHLRRYFQNEMAPISKLPCYHDALESIYTPAIFADRIWDSIAGSSVYHIHCTGIVTELSVILCRNGIFFLITRRD
jgi:hypothetical protein